VVQAVANIRSKEPDMQREYSGFDVIMLASEGHASPYWLTFNQCNKLGGRVKRDEHSSLVTFWQLGRYSRKINEPAKTKLGEACCSGITAFSI
jgi:antirestriction protein ArdC